MIPDVSGQINDIMRANRQLVQMVALLCLTALGIAAMVVNNEISNIIAVAVAAAVGLAIGYLFKTSKRSSDA